jgi:hypothetical protein
MAGVREWVSAMEDSAIWQVTWFLQLFITTLIPSPSEDAQISYRPKYLERLEIKVEMQYWVTECVETLELIYLRKLW